LLSLFRVGNLLNSSPFKGEAGRGMGLYRFYLLKDLVVPEAGDAKTSRLYPIPSLTLPLRDCVVIRRSPFDTLRANG